MKSTILLLFCAVLAAFGAAGCGEKSPPPVQEQAAASTWTPAPLTPPPAVVETVPPPAQPAATRPAPTPTASPTGNSPAVPAAGPATLTSNRAQVPESRLVLAELNPVAPEDVAAEMYFFGHGGPGDMKLCRPLPDTEQKKPKSGSLPSQVEMYFCWPDPESSVRFTVTDPKGKIDTVELPVLELDVSNFPGGQGIQRYVLGAYQVDLTRPAGKYTFTLQGQKLKVAETYNLALPKKPVIYEVYANPFDPQGSLDSARHLLHLSGFAPNERLRLFLYDQNPDTILVGWQTIQVGSNGKQWVEINRPAGQTERLAFGVTGPKSGLVKQPSLNSPIVCPGALPIRLQPGYARALRDLAIRADLKRDAAVVTPVRTGEVISVSYGPYCRAGAWWWAVSADSGNGYSPESTGKDYLLEPVP